MLHVDSRCVETSACLCHEYIKHPSAAWIYYKVCDLLKACKLQYWSPGHFLPESAWHGLPSATSCNIITVMDAPRYSFLYKKVVVCKLRHTRRLPGVYMTPGRDTSPEGTSHQKLTVSKSRKVTTPRILPLGHVRLLTPSLSFPPHPATKMDPRKELYPILDSQNRFAFLRAWNKCLLTCPVSENLLLTHQESFSYYSTYLKN